MEVPFSKQACENGACETVGETVDFACKIGDISPKEAKKMIYVACAGVGEGGQTTRASCSTNLALGELIISGVPGGDVAEVEIKILKVSETELSLFFNELYNNTVVNYGNSEGINRRFKNRMKTRIKTVNNKKSRFF